MIQKLQNTLELSIVLAMDSSIVAAGDYSVPILNW
jgi:hypothetical protein